MKKTEHFRKLKNMYLAAPCNEYYNPEITIEEGSAEIQIPVKKSFFHAAGATHGSVYFKALDDAAFFSANSLVENVFVLTTTFTVHLTRPISSGKMRANGRVVNSTRSHIIAESVLFDSKDREIARGLGSFMRSSIELSPDIGYK